MNYANRSIQNDLLSYHISNHGYERSNPKEQSNAMYKLRSKHDQMEDDYPSLQKKYGIHQEHPQESGVSLKLIPLLRAHSIIN